MAIVHADNFSMYGTSTAYMLDGVYAEVAGSKLVSDPDGLSAGVVSYVNPDTQGANAFSVVRTVLPSNQPIVGMAGRFYVSGLPTSSSLPVCYMQWRDASNAALASITLTTTGRLEFRQGTYNGTVISTTTNPVVTAKAWWHIEAVVNVTDSTFEIRVEGVTVLSGSITVASDISQMAYGVRSTGTSTFWTFYIKDYVLWDGTGSQNNDFLGSVSVYSLPPVSDVDSGWTLNGGAIGYGILDNNPPVDATEYLSAAYPAPDPSTFGLGTLPDNITSIKCLMTMVRAKKIDGGDGNLQNSLVSATNTVDGTDRPITAAFTYWRDFFPEDPDTSAPWLVNAAEAALLKINRTV